MFFCISGIILLLCLSLMYQGYSYISFFKLFKNADYINFCIVAKAGLIDNEVLKQSTSVINMGCKNFAYFDSVSNCENIIDADYFQVELNNSEKDVLNYLYGFGAKDVFAEKVENKSVKYLYMPMLCKHKFIDGKKVNIQIVTTNNTCLVGYPMIYTAY